MSDKSDNWPDYLLGTRDQYHALGVIAAAYNRLEYQLLGQFLIHMGFNQTSGFLFARLRDNSLRIELVRRSLGKWPNLKLTKAVTTFCDAFDRCAQNRNILMHSSVTSLTEDGVITHLVFSKAEKLNATEFNRFLLDLPTLRQIADDMELTTKFGRALFKHLTARYHTILKIDPPESVDIPPLPETLQQPALLTPQDLPTPKDV